jgi:hypothetical protein
LFILAAVIGLQRLSALRIHGRAAGRGAARLLLFLCAAHFAFWYGLHLFERSSLATAVLPYETWDAVNHRNPQRRILVNRQLERIPGQLLVFVRYSYPQHPFQDEWVYNRADIDGARVVWARDLGPEEDRKLLEYYPQRKALLLEPDAIPPQLRDYPEP